MSQKKSYASGLSVNSPQPSNLAVVGAGMEEMNGLYKLMEKVTNGHAVYRIVVEEESSKYPSTISYDPSLGWMIKSSGGRGFYHVKKDVAVPPDDGYSVSQYCNGPPPTVLPADKDGTPLKKKEVKQVTGPGFKGPSSNSANSLAQQTSGLSLNSPQPSNLAVVGAGMEEMNGVYKLMEKVTNGHAVYRNESAKYPSTISYDPSLGWMIKSSGGRGFYHVKKDVAVPPVDGYSVSQYCNGPPPKVFIKE